MLTYLRYALATFCFAASVGCLALCWRSFEVTDRLGIVAPRLLGSHSVYITAREGNSFVIAVRSAQMTPSGISLNSRAVGGRSVLDELASRHGHFATFTGGFYFPLWYPALIFALAGVGVLRFRRQFSIRSALICVSVVALLLGMAVAL